MIVGAWTRDARAKPSKTGEGCSPPRATPLNYPSTLAWRSCDGLWHGPGLSPRTFFEVGGPGQIAVYALAMRETEMPSKGGPVSNRHKANNRIHVLWQKHRSVQVALFVSAKPDVRFGVTCRADIVILAPRVAAKPKLARTPLTEGSDAVAVRAGSLAPSAE